MRVFATICALLLGTTLALGQGDAKISYEPVANAATAKPSGKTARTATKPKAPTSRAAASATAQSKVKAAEKPGGKPATGVGKTAATAAAALRLREAYLALPVAELMAIQSDLSWTGDYNGLIDGRFGERLVDAAKAYQKRQNHDPTGLLTKEERAALAEAARPRREEVGWRLTEDPVTGARVGIPSKLATRIAPHSSGTRWSSAQGQLQIETFRIETGASLEAIYEQEKSKPKRIVTYSVLRPDHFVVSGTQGLKKFYVRAFARNAEIRGIAVFYDQAMAGTMDRVVVAMSSAFVPFPDFAVAAGPAGIPVARRKVEYGTGLVVSDAGHILTAHGVTEDCHVLATTVGNAERLAVNIEDGLALLRVYGARRLSPIDLGVSVAKTLDRVTLVGVADPQTQGGGTAVTAVAAKLKDGSRALEAALVAGFAGAAALDDQGRFFGLVVEQSLHDVGGSSQARIIPLDKIRTFLESNGIALDADQADAFSGKAAVVRVICVRK